MLNCFDKEIFMDFINFLGLYGPRGKPRKGDDNTGINSILKPKAE